MFGIDYLERLFAIWAFLFQIVLIAHFALRKWRFEIALRYGPAVYALSIPAVAVSILLMLGGKPWTLWLSGFLYLVWALYGYTVEYRMKIAWRSPIQWQYLVPYVSLYLATVMFYWWPLALIFKPLWVGYTILFLISTFLNATSHHPPSTTPARAMG